MKKIISFVFNEFTNDIRVLKENLSLKNSGFDVTVVATLKKDLNKEETILGVKVRRVYVDYLNILPVQLLAFWIKSIFIYRKESIFHCNDLYALPIGAVIKTLFNKEAKVVYDCHEHETEAHVYHNKKLLKMIAKVIEKKLIKYADRVITVSEGIALEYQKMYNITSPALVLNCPNYCKYEKKDLFRQKFGIPKNRKILLYQGECRRGRGLETIIEAFKRMSNDIDVVMVFLAYGAYCDTLKELAKGGENIFFHEPVGIDIYMDYVCSADFGIHLMENTCLNHDLALPNKFFEYIMAGLPIMVSNLREMKAVVEKYKIGVILADTSLESFIDGLKRISNFDVTEMQNNLAEAAKVYNWENQERTLTEIYNNF